VQPRGHLQCQVLPVGGGASIVSAGSAQSHFQTCSMAVHAQPVHRCSCTPFSRECCCDMSMRVQRVRSMAVGLEGT
jgi:hypothetical protein